MAIAYESVAETNFTVGLSLVISKPTGLAVGDYMFAQICSWGGVAIDTPSGWTTYYNTTENLGGASHPIAVFYKQADSSDVAASNFTFTVQDAGGITEEMSGCIVRVSGMGAIDGSDTENTASTSSTWAYATGIDPTFADGLVLAFLFGGDNVSASVDFTAVAIATDNPTWTERADDLKTNAARSLGRSVYTAPRSAATAFGNATITFSPNGIGITAIFINLAPRLDGSHAVETGTSYFVNHPFLRTGAVDVDGDDPETRSENKTQWTNQIKPTVSDVTNINKP